MSESTPTPDDDLVLCHQEPIRVPGSVQPHGALLTLEGTPCVVRRASANLESLVGVSGEAAIGAPLQTLLEARAVAPIERAARALDADPDERAMQAFALDIDVRGTVRRFDATLFRSGAERVLELDGTRATGRSEGPTAEATSVSNLRALVQRLHGARGLAAMCETIVGEVRTLTGFDRVMVYRFHPDGHGEVVAESVIDAWPPYLGLHYPESDIPVQARELYRRNWIRCIAEVPYVPVPILPVDAPPLDLSLSQLRSVSPVHVEYLVNMGVGASMSISLLDGERLWGLIACHHGGPRPVAPDTRAACELLGTTFSLLLPSLEATAEANAAAELRDIERRLLTEMADAEPLTDGAFGHLPNLNELVASDGVASVSGEDAQRLGTTPDDAALIAFAAWLDEHVEDDVFASASIATVYPPASDWPHAIAGVLVIEISRARRQYLMAFRQEQETHVRWAGRPDEKHVVAAEGGGRRLSPRHSFAAWSEAVKGVSLPWQDIELRCAETFRRATLTLIVGRAEEVSRLARELARSREHLHAFAHIAAHDLKEPLRGIGNYATFLAEDLGDALDAEARRKIDTILRLAERGSSLADALLEVAEIGGTDRQQEPIALGEIVDQVIEMLAPELERRRFEVRVARPLPTLVGDRSQLEQALTNLVGNAIKYNDSAEPWIEIAAEPLAVRPEARSADWIEEHPLDRRSHVIRVSDNGIGIPEEQHEDVFRLFKRLHEREGYGGGSGIGLTIVKRIVELQGGQVSITETPGGGTTFRFGYGDPPD